MKAFEQALKENLPSFQKQQSRLLPDGKAKSPRKEKQELPLQEKESENQKKDSGLQIQ